MKNKKITEKDLVFSDDENTLTIGSDTYITANGNTCSICALDKTGVCDNFIPKCSPRFRKDGRDIVWKLEKQQ